MGEQRSESMRAREAKMPAGGHAQVSPPVPFLRSQQQAGNRGVGRLLALYGIQAKLTVAASGDRYESEADRVAYTVVGMPEAGVPVSGGISRVAMPVQRKCDHCEEEEQVRLKSSAGGRTGGLVAASVENSIVSARRGGEPMSVSMRGYFEPRFGADFGRVRLHTDSRASDLASAVGAHAFTSGQDIFFASGYYQPASPEGRRLLAHELTHSIQQEGAASPPLQREEAGQEPAPDEELDWSDKILVKTIAGPTYAMGSTIHSMVEATATGFVKQVKAEAKVKGEAFWKKVKDSITVSGAVAFVLHYWWGLIKGIFSPITGLIDLAKLAIQLMGLPQQILATAWKRRHELAEEATQLGQGVSALAGRVSDFLAGVKSHPIDTVKALAGWFSSLKGDAIKGAEKGGRSAGHALMAQLDKPLPELGEAAGEIVGTVLINIVLLVFTEGIGNAIGQIATKLGELGSFIGKFGKVAEMLAAVVSKIGGLLETIGVWVAKAEAAIAKVVETVLKPIGPVLEEFGKLVSGLRTFLRKLLGVSEEAAASAAEQAVGGAARAIEGKAPPPVAAPTAPKPTVKAPVASGAAEEAAGASGAKVAPKAAPPEPVAPKVAEPGPPPVSGQPTGAKLFEGLSEDTEALFASRPGLKKILEAHPDAAMLFKICKSPCIFPNFMTDQQIAERLVHIERMKAAAAHTGVPFEEAEVKKLLNRQGSVEEVDRALKTIEERLGGKIKGVYSGNEQPEFTAAKPTMKAPVASGAADEAAGASGASVAPKTAPPEPVTPKVVEPGPPLAETKPAVSEPRTEFAPPKESAELPAPPGEKAPLTSKPAESVATEPTKGGAPKGPAEPDQVPKAPETTESADKPAPKREPTPGKRARSAASKRGIELRKKMALERMKTEQYDPLQDVLTADERAIFIKSEGKELPKDIDWHHTRQTSADPGMADVPEHIQPTRHVEHIYEEHGGQPGNVPTAGIRGDVTSPTKPIYDPNAPEVQTGRYSPSEPTAEPKLGDVGMHEGDLGKRKSPNFRDLGKVRDPALQSQYDYQIKVEDGVYRREIATGKWIKFPK